MRRNYCCVAAVTALRGNGCNSPRGALRARVVIQNRREPALGLFCAPALALGVILDLIALDLADAEIGALRMAEIESAHRRTRPHREAFGEIHPDALGLEQTEEGAFLGVVRLRRIPRRRTDAAVALGGPGGV